MSLKYKITVKPSYLHVTFTGAFTINDAKHAFQEIFSSTTQHRLSKVLVDIRSLEGDMTTTERFELGEYIAQENCKYALQIGVLGVGSLVEPERFGELVARNRGANLKVVTDLQEILKWLDVEPANKDPLQNV